MLDKAQKGGWSAVAIFLAIAVATIAVLAVALRKTNPGHLTVGAVMVMLIYLVVGAFVVLASRIFVPRNVD